MQNPSSEIFFSLEAISSGSRIHSTASSYDRFLSFISPRNLPLKLWQINLNVLETFHTRKSFERLIRASCASITGSWWILMFAFKSVGSRFLTICVKLDEVWRLFFYANYHERHWVTFRIQENTDQKTLKNCIWTLFTQCEIMIWIFDLPVFLMVKWCISVTLDAIVNAVIANFLESSL